MEGLQQYMQEVIEPHEERDEHPLPLVLFFSDGYNTGSNPLSYAKKIKNLGIDGEPVTLACAGVSTSPSDQPDEALLKSIASPGCYLSIRDVELLSAYLAEVGSSGASSPKEVAEIMGRLADMRDGCEQ